mmetsp:Transcript_12608/g.36532  ORF Transcript_12608/g.36532 Transcript_12608/m.36532 type:complete len:202 (+) Transcript_12608:2113-2718(+)
MDPTASLRFAVSSTRMGALPEPTPSAGLPVEYDAFTMPGPPVARMMFTSSCFITWSDTSMDGCSIHSRKPSGAPASTPASWQSLTAATVLLAALGCGRKMALFRVLAQKRLLAIAVLVGFVVGVMQHTTPTGLAIFSSPRTSSLWMIPQVLALRYLSRMSSQATPFLMTLSSISPIPVSSCAMSARGTRALFAECAILVKM